MSVGPSEQSPLLGDRITTANREYETTREGIDRDEDDDSNPSSEEEISTARLSLICGSMFLGVFLSALDTTIVATLSGPISTSFNSFTLMSWIATGYLISTAALQPLSGKLTDIYGRRTGLVLANIFFGSGTLICGLARSEGVLILGRVVAGAGGGCLNTISTFVCTDLIPTRKRGLWQGFGNICFGVGAGLGGVFGGWVSDRWGWRWAFLVQVPFVVISGIIVALTVKVPVKETDRSRIKRVDFLGSFTLVLTLVLLLIGLNSGGNLVPWNHPLVYISLILSVICLGAFCYVEANVASEPVIPVRLLLDRTTAGCCIANWFGSMTTYSIFYYIPVYFQARGFSAAASGARLIPQSIGIGVGSIGGGFIMKTTGKYYWLQQFNQTCSLTAVALMVGLLNLYTQSIPPFIMMLLAGMGGGGMLTVTLIALISAVSHENQAVITSASYAFRSTGSTIGITISSTVFQNALVHYLWKSFGGVKDADKLIQKLRDDLSTIRRLGPHDQLAALNAYMDSLRWVWVAGLCFIVMGSLASLFIREYRLHTNLARK